MSLAGSPSTPRTERKFLGISLSPFGSPGHAHMSLGSLEEHFARQQDRALDQGNGLTSAHAQNGNYAQGGRNSKRSRSLIRRSSKKAKQQVNNVQNPEDCVVS